jgi:hypothetical protein
MGTHLAAINCPNCGTTYSGTNGPNYTPIAGPTAPGWTLVLLSCMGCQQILGPYTFPQQS